MLAAQSEAHRLAGRHFSMHELKKKKKSVNKGVAHACAHACTNEFVYAVSSCLDDGAARLSNYLRPL